MEGAVRAEAKRSSLAWPSWPAAKRPPGAGAYALALLGPALFLGFGTGLAADSQSLGAQLAVASSIVAVGAPYLWFRLSHGRARGEFVASAQVQPSGADADWTNSRTGAAGAFLTLTPSVAGSVALLLSWLAYTFQLHGSRRHPGKLALLGLVGAVAIGFVNIMARRWWRGNAQVTFKQFPYVVGEPIRLFVGMTPGSAAVLQARYLLRCVGEVPAAAGRKHGAWKAFWFEPGAPATDRMPGPDEFVELMFHPPKDLPGTSLHGDVDGNPRACWELLVQCRTTWGTVSETFVVPVYAAQRAGPVGAP